MGGRNLLPLIEKGVTFLKIYVGSCLACLTIGYAPEVAVKDPKTMVRINNKPMEWVHQIKYLSVTINKCLSFIQHFNNKVATNIKKI